MILLINFGLFGIVILMLMGVYSKLDDLSRKLQRLLPQDAEAGLPPEHSESPPTRG